jgi:hypothetical protein
MKSGIAIVRQPKKAKPTTKRMEGPPVKRVVSRVWAEPNIEFVRAKHSEALSGFGVVQEASACCFLYPDLRGGALSPQSFERPLSRLSKLLPASTSKGSSMRNLDLGSAGVRSSRSKGDLPEGSSRKNLPPTLRKVVPLKHGVTVEEVKEPRKEGGFKAALLGHLELLTGALMAVVGQGPPAVEASAPARESLRARVSAIAGNTRNPDKKSPKALKELRAKLAAADEEHAHRSDVWSPEWQEVVVGRAAKHAAATLNKAIHFVSKAAARDKSLVAKPSSEAIVGEALKATVQRIAIQSSVTMTITPVAPAEKLVFCDFTDHRNLDGFRNQGLSVEDVQRLIAGEVGRRRVSRDRSRGQTGATPIVREKYTR